eukprot:COSAG05_NODE_3569_length_1986_cov_2.229995_2_plen_40_part_00
MCELTCVMILVAAAGDDGNGQGRRVADIDALARQNVLSS